MKRIGELRYVATIKRPTKNPSDGGRVGQPETIVPIWRCSRETPRGAQAVVAQQIVPLLTHVCEGWSTGKKVSHKDYLEIEGRRFNIEFIDDSKPGWLRLLCVEEGQ
jgi:hypothetical protein